jgi:hypothetical protein
MKFRHLLARGAVAVALAASIGAVCAAESATTEILLLGKDQKREKLKFEGELPIGESRGLYTDAGTPVTVLRTEKGLRVETPERTVDVPYPDHGVLIAGEHALDADAGTDGKRRRVVILHNEHHTDGDAAHAAAHDKLMKRVIVVGDGSDVDVKVLKLDKLGKLEQLDELPELAGLAELDHLDKLEGLEALDALDAKIDVDVDVDAEGEHKVIVVRKIRKQDVQVD